MHRLPTIVFAAFLATFVSSALAQTKAQQQVSYFDLAVQGVGQFTHPVSGPVTISADDQGSVISQTASKTLGALITIRYAPKPYFGVEFNGGYARYTESYTVPPADIMVQPFQVQTEANEFTFGYLVSPPYTIFGVKPYASAGGGIIRFAPTAGGGEGVPNQGLPAVYYNVGFQKDVLDHVGIRVGFRQLFFQAPDFFENYLTIDKRTYTTEPMIGFYLHY